MLTLVSVPYTTSINKLKAKFVDRTELDVVKDKKAPRKDCQPAETPDETLTQNSTFPQRNKKVSKLTPNTRGVSSKHYRR